MISIAIIDIIGLTYDGDTLSKRGLGGSESAVILLAKELAKKNFKVTVFNNCIDKESKEGTFDNVHYIDHSILDYKNDFSFDVVISSRTVIPFLPPHLYNQFEYFKPQRYSKIKSNAKLKVMWMHDTFAKGDHLLEDMLVHGDMDEIFTLSDFQTAYVTNCDHGKKRNFEVLKKKVFMTRNGIVLYKNEVDIKQKDPHLYVYNASVTKGMLPLVENMWERIKQNIPQAKLKVIGGYYRFRENAEPDEQEKKWRELVADEKYKKLDVEFTGIIKQSEIADIMAKASFMLFPGAFPETFGISTLESLAYNTPLITTRFGALEETAVEQACYLIDYAIEPNSLFRFIDKKDQENKFVNMVLQTNANRYLHQQKMYSCNIIKGIVGWDSVALQWKQHIYKKIGEYLSKEEYKEVSHINSRVKKIFGRRFSNYEENYLPRNTQQKIVVVSPTYNASKYIERCIESVITQDYDNYLMVVIDDCSTDNTYELAKKYESDKIKVIRNTENKGAVRNQIESINNFCERDDIVMFLDGDDSLVNDNQIFHFYNNLYDGTTEFSYGSCWSMVDNIPLVSQPYPEQIKKEKKYRQYKFNWNMPYTHLRTFKAYLLENVDENMFKDEKGKWYKAGGDGSIFYSLIEKCEPEKIKVVQDIVYNYNDTHPLNDYKINAKEQTKNANRILTQ
jgi:glycosyltransferase involved in cell wall biosynthesis